MNNFHKDPFFTKSRKVPYEEMRTSAKFWKIVSEKGSHKDYLYKPKVLSYTTKPEYNKSVWNVDFENISFSKTEIRHIHFHNCNFYNCEFIGTHFNKVEFHDCKFYHCNMLRSTFEKVHVDPRAFEECFDPVDHSNIGALLFHELLENSKKINQPFFLDDSSYLLSVWKRYSLRYKLRKSRKNKNRLDWSKHELEIYSRATVNYLAQHLWGYGIKISKLMLSTLFILLFFSTTNYLFWNDFNFSSCCGIEEKSFINAFYYTTISITNLGYGDLTPSSSYGKFWASIQAVIGVIWIGIVIGVAVGKIDRFKA